MEQTCRDLDVLQRPAPVPLRFRGITPLYKVPVGVLLRWEPRAGVPRSTSRPVPVLLNPATRSCRISRRYAPPQVFRKRDKHAGPISNVVSTQLAGIAQTITAPLFPAAMRRRFAAMRDHFRGLASSVAPTLLDADQASDCLQSENHVSSDKAPVGFDRGIVQCGGRRRFLHWGTFDTQLAREAAMKAGRR